MSEANKSDCLYCFYVIMRMKRLLVLMPTLLATSQSQGANHERNGNQNQEGGETFDPIDTTDPSRPIINVYFAPIAPEQRFTGMTDEDDEALLTFWKDTWEAAGWQPRVLTWNDAKQHSLYDSFSKQLDELRIDEFGKLSILRWLAMAASGGGWLVDYDAFPLRDFRVDLPNNGEMTLFEQAAPILASGSADAWRDTAKFLLEDAKRNCFPKPDRLSFWTDTLGVLNAWRDPNVTLHVTKGVIDGRKAILKDRSLTRDDCDKRPFRGKRVVHFSYYTVFEAPIAPELRLPRHRLTVAKDWLPMWTTTCYNATTIEES